MGCVLSAVGSPLRAVCGTAMHYVFRRPLLLWCGQRPGEAKWRKAERALASVGMAGRAAGGGGGPNWREAGAVARGWVAGPAEEPDVGQVGRQVKSLGTVLCTCRFWK